MAVSAVDSEKLSVTVESTANKISSQEAKTKVSRARQIQTKRFKDEERTLYTNSQMRNRDVKKYCNLVPEAENILKLASDRFDFSARSYFRLIKVARTIADLAEAEQILPLHMAEALQYKQSL